MNFLRHVKYVLILIVTSCNGIFADATLYLQQNYTLCSVDSTGNQISLGAPNDKPYELHSWPNSIFAHPNVEAGKTYTIPSKYIGGSNVAKIGIWQVSGYNPGAGEIAESAECSSQVNIVDGGMYNL